MGVGGIWCRGGGLKAGKEENSSLITAKNIPGLPTTLIYFSGPFVFLMRDYVPTPHYYLKQGTHRGLRTI